MEDLKKTVAENIIRLRTNANMTQAQLGEKLNYSDKSVSKWERGESLPDAYVLKNIAELFYVSVDYLLSKHSDDEKIESQIQFQRYNHRVISLIAIFGVWAAVLIAFVTLWIVTGGIYWIMFVYAVPISLILTLIFNSIWGRNKTNRNVLIISGILWGGLACLYLSFLSNSFWQLFLIGVPLQIIIILCGFIKRRKPR